MKKYKKLLNFIYPIVALALFLAVWAIFAEIEKKPLVLPQVDEVFSELFGLLDKKNTWQAIGGTLLDALYSFLLSVIFALILSTLGIVFEPFHRLLSPINTILRATPTMAVMLLSVLWLDYDDCPMFIGFLVAFPLFYALFRDNFLSIDKNLLEMAKVFKVSKADQIMNIYLPSILPNMINSMQNTISLIVKVVIASEVMSYVSHTIGFEMLISNNAVEIAKLLAWTIIAILLSFVLEIIFGIIKRLTERKFGKNIAHSQNN